MSAYCLYFFAGCRNTHEFLGRYNYRFKNLKFKIRQIF